MYAPTVIKILGMFRITKIPANCTSGCSISTANRQLTHDNSRSERKCSNLRKRKFQLQNIRKFTSFICKIAEKLQHEALLTFISYKRCSMAD